MSSLHEGKRLTYLRQVLPLGQRQFVHGAVRLIDRDV
jgi:hypothetical protein